MRIINAISLVGLALTLLTTAQPSMSETLGAELFSERCVLCHGSQGMGEGALPLNIRDYPSTNLIYNTINQTREDIHRAIRDGSTTEFMPPWKDELSEPQIVSLIDFVMLLRENPKMALLQLREIESHKQKNIDDGKSIYAVRCVLCHGVEGKGDGRMRKVVKSPPPYNLTKSLVNREYLRLIISEGGEAVSRSPQMPPWKDQLSRSEIEAVIEYIISLRRNLKGTHKK